MRPRLRRILKWEFLWPWKKSDVWQVVSSCGSLKCVVFVDYLRDESCYVSYYEDECLPGYSVVMCVRRLLTFHRPDDEGRTLIRKRGNLLKTRCNVSHDGRLHNPRIENLVSQLIRMSTTVLWKFTSCSFVEVCRVSEAITYSIKRTRTWCVSYVILMCT